MNPTQEYQRWMNVCGWCVNIWREIPNIGRAELAPIARLFLIAQSNAIGWASR